MKTLRNGDDLRAWLHGQNPDGREVSLVIIHHTARPTRADAERVGGATCVAAIRRYHKKVRGWRDIGYHLLIGPAGEVYPGRPLHLAGAHCYNERTGVDYNPSSVGIAVLADYDREDPGGELEGLAATIAILRGWYPGLRRLPLTASVKLHRQLDRTSCPGLHLPYPVLLQEIQRYA